MRKTIFVPRVAALAAMLVAGVTMWATAATAATTCDRTPGSSDATALAETFLAIDDHCPCNGFDSRGDYRSCARGMLRSVLDNGILPQDCKREGKAFSTKSRCGQPSAVVCCRTDSNGRERHKVLDDAAECASDDRYAACVPEQYSVLTGCDASGCIQTCGNSTIDPGEDCEAPGTPSCSDQCLWEDVRVCSEEQTCGNLVVDEGESCEPPATSSCDDVCQTVLSCAAPEAGEIDIACVQGVPQLTAAGAAGGYLAAWTGPRGTFTTNQILARRFDVLGTALEPWPVIVSDEEHCATVNRDLAGASNGSSFFVYWRGQTFNPGTGQFIDTFRGRTLGIVSGVDATINLGDLFAAGVCHGVVDGPVWIANVSSTRYAASSIGIATCFGNEIDRGGSASYVELAPGTFPKQPKISNSLPSVKGMRMDDLGGDTLWAWISIKRETADGPIIPIVAANWTDGTSSSFDRDLTTRQALSPGRPAVSAGAQSLLVAWTDGASETTTDVRAIRVTKAAGNLDVAGGILLASVPGGVSTEAAAVFDGTRWLVAWSQPAGASNEIRAVAVNADGTVVDASPRLIASNVRATVPALSSAGDGHVLVLFERDDGSNSGVRAKIVVP